MLHMGLVREQLPTEMKEKTKKMYILAYYTLVHHGEET